MKRRWSETENQLFADLFQDELRSKKMPKTFKLMRAKDQLPERTVEQIRTKIHNVINNKQKFSIK